jgi:hypothetical protein
MQSAAARGQQSYTMQQVSLYRPLIRHGSYCCPLYTCEIAANERSLGAINEDMLKYMGLITVTGYTFACFTTHRNVVLAQGS